MSDFPRTTGSESGIDDREVLDAIGAAVIVTDGSGRIVQWNSTTTEMFGWLGDEGPRRIVQSLLATGGPQRRAASANGAGTAQLVPSMSGDGSVLLFAVERTELAEPGGGLAIWTVSEVGLGSPWADPTVLSGSKAGFPPTVGRGVHTEVITDLDRSLLRCGSSIDVLEVVPGVLVPRIAEWCGVYLAADSEVDEQLATFESNTAASGPAIAQAAAAWCSEAADDRRVQELLRRVIASGEMSRVDLADPASVADQQFGDRAARTLRSCGIHTSLMVPFWGVGRPVGALHLLRGADSGPIADDETNWLGQIAVRIAATLAPLRESDRNQDLAVIFQEALLPDDFPAIPDVEVAARYRPGIADVEIGGDFYDVVGAGQNRWAAVMGDICGRGPAAAAQTGRVRHSFRMSAWHGDSPVEILDWIDRALRTGGDGVLCTAAVASLERAADGTFELTCALGGHPPPILCRADGSVEYFGEYGTLLGTELTVHNVAVSTALGPDDAVFFYTDGITDASPPHQLSQSQLLGLVGDAWADLPEASVLADRVLAEADRTLALDERTDDIALLVFRRT